MHSLSDPQMKVWGIVPLSITVIHCRLFRRHDRTSDKLLRGIVILERGSVAAIELMLVVEHESTLYE